MCFVVLVNGLLLMMIDMVFVCLVVFVVLIRVVLSWF